MKRFLLIFVGIVAAIWLTGCGPMVVVENHTSFPIRVVVTTKVGRVVLSPSPGESSSTDAAAGTYSAVAIPDTEWIEYAKITRKYLNEQLANADKLTGPQLLDVVHRLKEIAIKMQQFEAAAGSGSKCSGQMTEDSLGIVIVQQNTNGALVTICK